MLLTDGRCPRIAWSSQARRSSASSASRSVSLLRKPTAENYLRATDRLSSPIAPNSPTGLWTLSLWFQWRADGDTRRCTGTPSGMGIPQGLCTIHGYAGKVDNHGELSIPRDALQDLLLISSLSGGECGGLAPDCDIAIAPNKNCSPMMVHPGRRVSGVDIPSKKL